jgi:hypothetical protein
MKRSVTGLMAVLFCFAAACSGGSGGGDVGGGGGLAAGFVAEEPSPGADTVNAGEGSTTNDLVTVLVNVTDTDGIYAAAFDLLYDADHATYVGWTPGNLLEQGGNSVFYDVGTPQTGRLVVSASRQGNVAGANASGTRTVIGLTFRVEDPGTSPITYQSNTLLDAQQQPQPINGIVWFGGTLTGV